MPSYPMVEQKMIVAATMCLHNLIHENNALDNIYQQYLEDIARHQSSQNSSTYEANDINMDVFRDDLARTIMQSRA